MEHDFSIWRRGLEKRRQAAENERKKNLVRLGDAIDSLTDQYEWRELFIFGSVIKKGRFDNHSDLDIGVTGLDKFLHCKFASELSNLLDREVDVVRLEECHFAEAVKKRGVKWNRKKL